MPESAPVSPAPRAAASGALPHPSPPVMTLRARVARALLCLALVLGLRYLNYPPLITLLVFFGTYLLFPRLFLKRQYRNPHEPASLEDARAALLAKWEAVAGRLGPDSAVRYAALKDQTEKLTGLSPPPEFLDSAGSPEVESSHVSPLLRPGEHLLWLYLKLLLARDLLIESGTATSEARLREEREALLRGLGPSEEGAPLSAAVRESRTETLAIIEQRLAAIAQRAARLEEIDSDLARIGHRVALLREQAAQQSPLGDAGLRIRFDEHLSSGLTGGPLSSPDVQEMDRLITTHLRT